MVNFGRWRHKPITATICAIFVCSLVLSGTYSRREPQNTDHAPSNNWTSEDGTTFRVPPFSKWTPLPCGLAPPTVLAIVHSSPTHVQHRKAIRRTWGGFPPGPNATIRTIFVVGRSKQDKVQRLIFQEAEQHGDVVTLDVSDSYRNLSLKHLGGLKWALLNCPTASYVLKTDDDALVDVRRTLGVLKSSVLEDTLACRIVPEGSSPKRSGKWSVTPEEYPVGEQYPEYCSGLAYFATMATARKLYRAATSGAVRYLWIDDVFVTGLAARAAAVRRLDMGVWFARTEQDLLKWMKSTAKKPLMWFVVEMTPRHWPAHALTLWSKMSQSFKEETIQ